MNPTLSDLLPVHSSALLPKLPLSRCGNYRYRNEDVPKTNISSAGRPIPEDGGPRPLKGWETDADKVRIPAATKPACFRLVHAESISEISRRMPRKHRSVAI